MGLAPEFTVALTKKSKFDFLQIVADDKMVDHYVSDMAKRYGKMTQPDISEKTDLIMGEFKQLDSTGQVLEGGIEHTASVALDIVQDKKAQKALVGLKENDQITIRINKDFSNDAHHMLNIKKEELETLDADFRFTVNKISRMEPAELNQELFDKVFGKDSVKTKKEFRAKVKEEVKSPLSVRAITNSKTTSSFIIKKTKLCARYLLKWLVA